MNIGASKFREFPRDGWSATEPGEVWNRARSPKAVFLAAQWVRFGRLSQASSALALPF